MGFLKAMPPVLRFWGPVPDGLLVFGAGGGTVWGVEAVAQGDADFRRADEDLVKTHELNALNI